MKCRVCNNLTNKIYETPKLPEYIWPSKKKIKISKCKVFSCKKCYSLQLQKFSKKRIKSFYGEESFNIITKKNHKDRINIIKKNYYSKFFEKKNIIDIGGGVNPIFDNKNVDIMDIKISKKIKKKSKNNIYVGDIEEKKIKKKYDIIFLLHTLEHILNPLKAIKNIENLLKKNGRIFIEIPNFDYFIRKRPHYAVFHQHLNMYNIKNFKNLLSFTELSIEKVFTNNSVIFCSLKKKNKINKILKLNLKKKFQLLKHNLKRQKKLLINFSKKNFLYIYGAGGSSSLFIANHKFIIKKILNIYDNDNRKISKRLPGTKLLIKKTKKNKDNKSISFYKLNRRNNFFLNEM